MFKRTTVWLSHPQVAAIQKLAAKHGVKSAEMLRRLIDVGLEASKK